MRVALLVVLLFLLGTVGFAFELFDDDHVQGKCFYVGE